MNGRLFSYCQHETQSAHLLRTNGTSTLQALALFDIDATLITTSGCGMHAMLDAGREVFGPSFTTQGIDFAGRLDPLLVQEFFVLNGVAHTPENVGAFRGAYRRHLEHRLVRAPRKTALPGVLDILSRLREASNITLGLLTGNYAETGQMKLHACGIDPEWFPIRAWGDDSPQEVPDRAHLPPVAMARYRERFGRSIEPSRVTIIGDTPHDIRCARESGCRVIAVATGRHSRDQLAMHGPDLVLETLGDAERVVTRLLASAG